MDDEFLSRYRQAPRPEFARRLQDQLEQGGTMTTKRNWLQTVTRWSPAALAAAIVIAAVLLFTFPPAQAWAQGFLDVFRVKKFATITIDPARLQQLKSLDVNAQQLLSDEVKVIKDPGKPVKVQSVTAASKAAGFTVATPSGLPAGAKVDISVEGAGAMQFTANTEKLQSILDMLSIKDVQVPQALNGAKITVNKPASVMLHYTLDEGNFDLVESPSPEVNLPAGVSMAQLGEIGLRVLGMNQQDAHDFAAKTDWSSTFLIPVPADAATVRQVSVNGAQGLMLSSTGEFTGSSKNNPKLGARLHTPAGAPSPYAQGNSVLLWANNGMVYAIQGNSNQVDMLQIANSVK